MDPIKEGAAQAAETVVGPSVKIQGDLVSEGNIRIEGSVTGKVKTSQSVFVGPDAFIAADVSADNAVVSGQIQGNMKLVGKLLLQSSARVQGDISCGTLVVEEGAEYNGKCSMGTPIASPGKGKNGKQAAEVVEETEE